MASKDAQAGSDELNRSMQDLSIDGEKKKGPKQAIQYTADKVIGHGSFGVVYKATATQSGETVAIKKVLQDKRFKNRELQVMQMLEHPSVVRLLHCFYSRGERNPDKGDRGNTDVFLNLVMEFIPCTIHRTLRTHTKQRKLPDIFHTKIYTYQIARALAYIHSKGVCHRDIKPQNLLLDPTTHIVKLCDFGSAKILVEGQPNVAYICSRYYRAPELVFEATEYTTAIDVWSLGCVLAELLIGNPLFPGESSVDQLIEIIKILGTPSKEEVKAMNKNHTSFKFPQIKAHPWEKVFRTTASEELAQACDLASKLLCYSPQERMSAFECMAHPFFDKLREKNAKLPDGADLPPTLFNFTDEEIATMKKLGLYQKMMPKT